MIRNRVIYKLAARYYYSPPHGLRVWLFLFVLLTLGGGQSAAGFATSSPGLWDWDGKCLNSQPLTKLFLMKSHRLEEPFPGRWFAPLADGCLLSAEQMFSAWGLCLLLSQGQLCLSCCGAFWKVLRRVTST